MGNVGRLMVEKRQKMTFLFLFRAVFVFYSVARAEIKKNISEMENANVLADGFFISSSSTPPKKREIEKKNMPRVASSPDSHNTGKRNDTSKRIPPAARLKT